jgi:hypothetical protein
MVAGLRWKQPQVKQNSYRRQEIEIDNALLHHLRLHVLLQLLLWLLLLLLWPGKGERMSESRR